MLSYLIIILLVSIITFVIVYLDSIVSNKKNTKKTYFKLIIMNIIISVIIISFLTWLSPQKSIMSFFQKGGSIKVDKPLIDIKEIGEQIISGEAPF
jgi:ABC-type enterobactin transport system permease subunit